MQIKSHQRKSKGEEEDDKDRGWCTKIIMTRLGSSVSYFIALIMANIWPIKNLNKPKVAKQPDAT